MEELVNKSDELGCQIESSEMGEIFKGPLISYTPLQVFYFQSDLCINLRSYLLDFIV